MMECEREFAEQAGYERGIQEGMEKGREEALIQTTKKLFAKGMSVNDVSDITGLSIDCIQKMLDCSRH